MANNKIPLVLYSGGMDSTVMLYEELREHSVDTLYIRCNGTEGRTVMEKRARAKAREIFMNADNPLDLPGRIQNDREIVLDETLIQVKGFKLIQPLAWLIGGLMAFDPTQHSELLIGYILGDTAPIKSKELVAFWQNAYALMHWCKPSEAPPVRFPLVERGYHKLKVLEGLPHMLADKVWVCELPVEIKNGEATTYRYCKKCPSCRTHLHALSDYKHEYNWDYGKWILHQRTQYVSQETDLPELCSDPLKG